MTNHSELPAQTTENLVQMNVQVPESLKSDAKEIGLYLGLNLTEFVMEALKEKIASHGDIKAELLIARRDRARQKIAETTAILDLLDKIEGEPVQSSTSDS